ncbi:hypothetical protein Plec18167_007433 [Paecilomyces lecythidis]|uniref:Uncharacterized protein n=1 Tax=Paecilomyces lecythidis TaxID=3004212 RepID=A0ABR3X3Z8_9EURO
MLEHKLLSSLLLFDINCIQELLQVFLLIKYKGTKGSCREQMESCMQAFRSLPVVGWTKRELPEITALLHEAGILEDGESRNLEKQDTERERGIQLFLQNTANAEAILTTQEPLAEMGTIPEMELNFDPAQMDIFDTLDLDMGIFSSMDWPDV